MTVSELLDEWADYYLPHLSPKTRSTTKDVIRRVNKYLGAAEVEAIEFDFLQRHLNAMRDIYAPRTIQSNASVLRLAYDYYIRKYNHNLINPADDLLLPLNTTEIQTFTVDEVRALLLAANRIWLRDAILLAYTTGMRRGEVVGLMFDDINFEDSYLSVHRSCVAHDGVWYLKPPKTPTSYRDIYLGGSAMTMLERRRMTVRSRYVFPSPHDNSIPINPLRITETMRNLCKRLGITQRGFHALRHTHATLAIKAKCNAKALSARLGHHNVAITLALYDHPDYDEQIEIAHLDCFDVM